MTGQELMEELTRKGIARGSAPLVRMLERRLQRPITPLERERVLTRIDTLGPARVGDVILDFEPAALDAWLADPNAR